MIYVPCSLISCITISTNRFTKKIDCFQDHRNISFLFLRYINPFLANIPALYLLKTPENIWFSGVFRGYKMGKLTSNGLKASGKMLISDQIVSIFLWSKGRWSNFFVEINTKCNLFLVPSVQKVTSCYRIKYRTPTKLINILRIMECQKLLSRGVL